MRWFAAFVVLATGTTASAQVVNVQSVLATPSEEGLSGSLSGSADWRTGNVDLLRLSAAPVARYRHGDHLLVGIAQADYGANADARFLAKTFEHLRYRWQMHEVFLLETFAQHAYDQFRRLEVRALFGVGVGARIANSERFSALVGVAYMPEIEHLRDDEQIDADDTNFFHRASSYVTAAAALDKRIQLIQTVYVQPVLDQPGDIRLLSESQLVVQLSESLRHTTGFSVAYDSRPPVAVEELDTGLTATLTYSF